MNTRKIISIINKKIDCNDEFTLRSLIEYLITIGKSYLAIPLLEKLHNKGIHDYDLDLALEYKNDEHIKNEKRAFELFCESAQYNQDEWSIFFVGYCYFRGVGVEKDIDKALTWISKVAKMNNPNAIYVMGLIYDFEVHDKVKAIEWYRRYLAAFPESEKVNDIQFLIATIDE